ncbi:MAG TPA: TIGR04255 family protein [Flavipsychrobacter sp.]|nr:TIGR04255 family protein [Flavipsychrobacter sp.]
MQLPKKVNDEAIRESVVEIRYESDLPQEILVGLFFQAFDDSYTYTNKPLDLGQLQQLTRGLPSGINIDFGGVNILYNDKISLKLSPNSFVFNCVGKYIGWAAYQPEISKALMLLFNTGYIAHFSRAGIRYISEFAGKQLKDCVKLEFSFGLPEVKSKAFAFRSEFELRDRKAILNLSNNMNATSGQVSSIIDVDIIAEGVEINSVEELLKELEDIHQKEKEVYFGMLREEFLHSLQPEY